VAAAREVVDGLEPQDRATLVLFDAAAHAAVPATADRVRLRQALDAAEVGPAVTRYTPALKLAETVLAGSDRPRRDVVLISDLQRSGWEGAAGVEFPAGTTVLPVLMGGEEVDNLVVTGATLERARVSGRERVTATAQVANRGVRAATGVEVSLEVAGRVIQSVRVDVEAGDAVPVPLQPLTVGDAPVAATIRAGSDPLPIDNVFHFVLAPGGAARVLVVQPEGRDAGLYVRRALELSRDPPVAVATRRGTLPTAAELAATDVVVLQDVLPGDDAAGRRLLEWVRAGGGVIVAMGDRTGATPWGAVARELAGGVPGRVEDRLGGGGARLGFVDYDHPVWEPFRGGRADFAGARFYRARAVPAGGPGVALLARFDDGSPALVSRQLGSGRVLVWGSSLDAVWTNLPLEPLFLPLVHQLARHASGFTPARPWTLAGQVVDVSTPTAASLVLLAPGGGRTDLGENPLVRLDEPGFYEVREARPGAGPLALHAVNVDVSESELTALDPTAVVAALAPPGGPARGQAAVALPREEQERRQSLWWYLLVTAFVLLTAEAVLANRRSGAPA
jgi:hypothetical protein